MSLNNNVLTACTNKIKWIILQSDFEQEVYNHTAHILDAYLYIQLYCVLYCAQV